MTSQNSSLHRKTLEVLSQTPPFTTTRVQEEVAVSDLFSSYPNNRDRYDIVLPDFKCIIECHGIQHYKAQSFGMDAGDALIEFQSLKNRDAKKKEIALLHGWTYIEIPYTDEKRLNSEYLLEAYRANLNEAEVIQDEDPYDNHLTALVQKAKKWFREKSRAQRREQYQRLKKLKKERCDRDRRSNRKLTGA